MIGKLSLTCKSIHESIFTSDSELNTELIYFTIFSLIYLTDSFLLIAISLGVAFLKISVVTYLLFPIIVFCLKKSISMIVESPTSNSS